MPNISSSELIAQFQTALRDDWGYIYGASGEIWTQAQQNAASREQTKKYGQKWVGHRVTDCSGLFAWAFRQLGGYCYHGSNTMFRRYSSASGSLSAGKRTDGEPLKPGTAVYKFNASEGYHHVGLYIGEGKVIEAKVRKVDLPQPDGPMSAVISRSPTSSEISFSALKSPYQRLRSLAVMMGAVSVIDKILVFDRKRPSQSRCARQLSQRESFCAALTGTSEPRPSGEVSVRKH